MIYSLMMQIKLVVFSLLAGIITGIIFDFYNVLRGMERIPNIIVAIEDILFWIFASIIIFIFLLYTHAAVISVYVYVWIIIGVVIYFKTASKFFKRFHSKTVRNSFRVIRIAKNMILYPFKLLLYNSNSKK
ncbi:spore cortex biosynthesis protein YabQ [Clostridium sp. 19966]|uniref:spore cortex biosynthesis protein YabQ n=1 Tax=Clostridium sp. 19966 TaxID=2768166 RepID=UPI0028DF6023|nr:spore cortex biosynthesis protein YabQ [Clostridium sp. 19966]MDT8715748.1 spore cortex biosynthesis protein YabQ [Clostridium sp. 19966]